MVGIGQEQDADTVALRTLIEASRGEVDEQLGGAELTARIGAALAVWREQRERVEAEDEGQRKGERVLVPEWLANVYEQQPVLQLGAGRKPIQGAVNHSGVIPPGVLMPFIDLQRDLDLMPWDKKVKGQDCIVGSYGTIVGLDLLEHIEDVLGFLVECARLLVPGGLLYLRYGASDNPAAYGDPTHKHWLMDSSLDFVCQGTSWGDHYGAFYVDTLGRYIDRYTKVSVGRTNADPRWPNNGDWLAVLRKLG